ncbi:DUF4157 domain-containing protein [Streptomyces sp. NPDC050400]|uniref:DUF4157 domain-containing protein n=1 Tax=Streptomyces sp. NPDC050400 TaxID=3365610 RepID=UPI0037A52687
MQQLHMSRHRARRSVSSAATAMATSPTWGPEQRLPEATRRRMESSFGWDFSSVRIHTGPQADAATYARGARAFTVGDHVVFSHGTYVPDTPSGDVDLAHELAHVVQQTGELSSSATGCAEREANDAARTHMSGYEVRQSAPVGFAFQGEESPRAEPSVLVLGRYERPIAGRKLPVSELLLDEGRRATGLRPVLMGQLAEFPELFGELAPSGLASATVLQGALKGGGKLNIKAIYLNTAGVDLYRGGPLYERTASGHLAGAGAQTSAEFRGLIAAMAAGTHEVDIYIEHAGGVSRIGVGARTVSGAPLPEQLRNHLPPSFFPHTGPPGSSPPSGGSGQPGTVPLDEGEPGSGGGTAAPGSALPGTPTIKTGGTGTWARARSRLGGWGRTYGPALAANALSFLGNYLQGRREAEQIREAVERRIPEVQALVAAQADVVRRLHRSRPDVPLFANVRIPLIFNESAYPTGPYTEPLWYRSFLGAETPVVTISTTPVATETLFGPVRSVLLSLEKTEYLTFPIEVQSGAPTVSSPVRLLAVALATAWRQTDEDPADDPADRLRAAVPAPWNLQAPGLAAELHEALLLSGMTDTEALQLLVVLRAPLP